MTEPRAWPTWAWVLLLLQVAILVVAILPWLSMAGMMGGMMQMPGMMPMSSMMPGR